MSLGLGRALDEWVLACGRQVVPDAAKGREPIDVAPLSWAETRAQEALMSAASNLYRAVCSIGMVVAYSWRVRPCSQTAARPGGCLDV